MKYLTSLILLIAVSAFGYGAGGNYGQGPFAASQAQVNAGTDNSSFVTSQTLAGWNGGSGGSGGLTNLNGANITLSTINSNKFDLGTLALLRTGGAFPATNITVWTSNSTSAVSPAITVNVNPITAPGYGTVLEQWGSVYSNATYNGVWRRGNNDYTNTYGDPQFDNTWHSGFNYNDGNGSYICTNQASYIHQTESCWQNYAGQSQLEDWYAWGTPYTPYGTNMFWRFMGGTLAWSTAGHTNAIGQWNFAVDGFSINDIFGNTVLGVSTSRTPNGTGTGSGSIYAYARVNFYTNANASGAQFNNGCGISLADPHNTDYYTLTMGSQSQSGYANEFLIGADSKGYPVDFYQTGGLYGRDSQGGVRWNISSNGVAWYPTNQTAMVYSTNGIASYATSTNMTLNATGCTNLTGVAQVIYVTAATGAMLYDCKTNAEWSGTQTIAALTELRVQALGAFTGTAITYANLGGAGHAW